MKIKKKHYPSISEHIFLASRIYSTEYDPIVIIANSEKEAMFIAEKYYGSSSHFIFLEKLEPSKQKQTYKIVGV